MVDRGDLNDVDEMRMIAQDQVRISNIAFSKKKISEIISCYFAILGIGCTIIASEINYFYNLDDSMKDHIVTMLIIANASTGFLSKTIFYSLLTLVLSIFASNLLYL